MSLPGGRARAGGTSTEGGRTRAKGWSLYGEVQDIMDNGYMGTSPVNR